MEKNRIILYTAPGGNVKLEVFLQDETLWLTQKMMAELFEVTVPNVSMHIRNIFDEEELNKSSTVKEFLIIQNEGGREVTRDVDFYNLDAIIAVG